MDSKILELKDFLTGPGQTTLQKGALVVEVMIPQPPRQFRGSFMKLGRVSKDLAVVNVAAGLVFCDDGKTVSDAKLALGAVGPTAIMVEACKDLLMGKEIDAFPLAALGEAAIEAVHPISDLRATAEYRKMMARVLSQRAIKLAAESSST
jgi:carbon-monoxide dehydrogenase medium subunit